MSSPRRKKSSKKLTTDTSLKSSRSSDKGKKKRLSQEESKRFASTPVPVPEIDTEEKNFIGSIEETPILPRGTKILPVRDSSDRKIGSDLKVTIPLESSENEDELQKLLHFRGPTNPFLKGRRKETREILSILFGDLASAFDTATATKNSLYLLREATLKRLKSDLENLLKGDENSSQALLNLLSSDNPISRVLLKNPQVFKQILNKLPNTEDSHAMIENVEKLLIRFQDASLSEGKLSEIPLTVDIHEICYKKKTEILEELISQGLDNDISEIPEELRIIREKGLRILRKIGKDNYWKILIDGKVHENGNKHYYDRSKGYMASMMKGLLRIVEGIGSSLDIDFVKQLHQSATELVTNEIVFIKGFPIGMKSTDFQETGIKQTPNSWGVTISYTEDGMTELASLRDELDAQTPEGYVYFSEDKMRFETRDPDRVVQWKAGKGEENPKLQDIVENLIIYVIKKAYNEIAQAKKIENNEDNLIGAIVDCCRGLGIIHPFKDANGRLIMFLILNKLLMEQGLSPTILEDQGFMIGKSRAELIDLIKKGQEKLALEDKGNSLLQPRRGGFSADNLMEYKEFADGLSNDEDGINEGVRRLMEQRRDLSEEQARAIISALGGSDNP